MQPEEAEGAAGAVKRILFVDDEPRVLQGVRRMLHSRHREWQIETAEGGREALERMDEQAFDVVVTDMRMPEMDGAELLDQVRTRFPETIRIILSGHASVIASLRSILVAHQFAAKPLAAEDLVSILTRACSLSSLIHDHEVRRVVGSIELLPEPPQAYLECVRALKDEDNAVSGVVAVIEKDPALAAKILQVVNSAFFGLPQRTSDLQRAVSYLGTETVKGVVLALEALRFGEQTSAVGPISLDTLRNSSVLSAQLSRQLRLGHREDREHLYTAALLHDIGYLTLLSKNQQEETAAAVELSDLESVPFAAARERLGGPAQSRLGAYLLGAWGLPMTVVEAVRDQNGGEFPGSVSAVTRGVHLVDRATKMAMQELWGADAFNRVELLPEFLASDGGEGQWRGLLESAREAIAASRAA